MGRHRGKLLLTALVVAVAAIVVALAGSSDDSAPPPATDDARRPPAREPADRDGRERDRDREGDASPVGDGTVPGPDGRLVVGMGDQKPDLFRDPRFAELGIRHVRLVVPWNAALTGDPETAAWLEAAGDREVLGAFNHAAGAQCPADPCEAPGPGEFARAFRAFRERFPQVREFATWNEPNHASQPVAHRPELVARYFDAIRRECRGCTVLAADVVADHTAARWLRGFDRRARRWGVHNYSDTNRFTSAGTRAFLRLVDGRVWITETGGIVEFTTADGRRAFRRDVRRAARATRQMFRIARSDPRIERLYVYHWNQVRPPGRFDAGLVGPDGDTRPAYDVVRDELAR